MTIDPKDLRTLLIRVTLVTLAVRVVPMLSSDPAPGEVAAALGLGADGLSTEPYAALLRGWQQATGSVAFALRLPALLAELALPLLAVAYARAAGWGAIPGLVAALVLAMAPLGVAAGWRVDGGALLAALGLAALVLLRQGLRDGAGPRLVGSAVVLGAAGWLAPPLLLLAPAGLYQAARAVTLASRQRLALGLWLGVPLAVLGARLAEPGWLVPAPDAAAAWRAGPQLAAAPSGWGEQGALQAAAEALAAVSPAGPFGALAGQLEILAAPWWALLGGGLLVVAALVGLVRGQVRPDPQASRPVAAPHLPRGPAPAETADVMDAEAGDEAGDADTAGAGAADGWRTLGVGAALSVPRDLGDRDVMPLLLGILGAVAFCAQAAARDVPDGVAQAIAAARPLGALLLGVGLVALVMPKGSVEAPRDVPTSLAQSLRVRRRFNLTLAAAALAIFALGAWHLLAQTRAPERVAPAKVARFAVETMAGDGALLSLGPRGLPVAWHVDARGHEPRVRRSALEVAEAQAHLVELLRTKPTVVVLTGDAPALGPTGEETIALSPLYAVRRNLENTLEVNGFRAVEDSHRFLGETAVVGYTRAEAPRPLPGTVVPQLGPGQAP